MSDKANDEQIPDYNVAVGKFMDAVTGAILEASKVLPVGEVIGCLEIRKADLLDSVMRAKTRKQMDGIIAATKNVVPFNGRLIK